MKCLAHQFSVALTAALMLAGCVALGPPSAEDAGVAPVLNVTPKGPKAKPAADEGQVLLPLEAEYQGDASLAMHFRFPPSLYRIASIADALAALTVTLESGTAVVARAQVLRSEASGGTASVRFTQLKAGTYVVRVEAFDAAKKLLGRSETSTEVKAGVLNQIATQLKLTGASSDPSTGELAVLVEVVEASPAPLESPHPMPSPVRVPVFLVPSPSPSASRAPAGRVLFDADVARKGLSAYASVIHRERIAIVDDPLLGASRRAMKFTVYDTDLGPTENPRAQVEAPRILNDGDEVWIGWSMLFPTSWPDKLPSGGWLTLSSVYGPPYAGAGPARIGIPAGPAVFGFQRNGSYGFDIPWTLGALQKNRWYDIVVHEKLSRDERVGFVEIYLNVGTGWKQQLLDGKQRLYMKTMDSANGGGANNHRLTLYRKKGMFPVLTCYHAAHRIGTSFEAVAPNSYPSSR